MRRGELSNVSAYEVWVHWTAILRPVEKSAWALWKRQRYTIPDIALDWVWEISHNVSPVFVWTGKPVPLAGPDVQDVFSSVRRFESFDEALRVVRTSPRIVELVVGEDTLVTPHSQLWERDRTYGRRG